MKAIQILMEEHRVIERVLTALEIAAQRLQFGEEIRPAFFINVALLNKNYTDDCHHYKEESILFREMNTVGISNDSDPLATLLADHAQGREFTSALKDAAVAWERGDQRARPIVAHNALGYVSLLRHQLQKEAKILFPLVEQAIPIQQRERVDADFERTGQAEDNTGIQEKFRALAEVLEKESTRKI